jgi:hypothetical protein
VALARLPGAWGQKTYTEAVGPLSATDYPVWTTEIEVPEGVYFEFEWLKKRNGSVVERSPCRYGMKAGHDAVWCLEG